MTINEALKLVQKRGAGLGNRSTVKYAETLLDPGEEPVAAVMANVVTKRDRWPGVVVLTEQHVIAACGLPGIKRTKIFKVTDLVKCEEADSIITYKVTFQTKDDAFSMTVDPDTGDKLSPYIAHINGDDDLFDDVKVTVKTGVFSQTLVRSNIRKRRKKEKVYAAMRAERERRDAILQENDERYNADLASANASAGAVEDDAQSVAERLERNLERKKAQGKVSSTDPAAVAARLAAELAEQEAARAALEAEIAATRAALEAEMADNED